MTSSGTKKSFNFQKFNFQCQLFMYILENIFHVQNTRILEMFLLTKAE